MSGNPKADSEDALVRPNQVNYQVNIVLLQRFSIFDIGAIEVQNKNKQQSVYFLCLYNACAKILFISSFRRKFLSLYGQ